jgi:hypothetical protein
MNYAAVEKTLHKALEEARRTGIQPGKHSALIDFVLDNTHLTYKYILITAFAAKATDATINPLVLQAKSTLPGAYDARSVCHKVIVNFEMTELGKALGGSNEPFLNKPARFKELSKENAVRRGSDQRILFALVDGLPQIESSADAYDGLVYAIQKLLIVKTQKEALANFDINSLDTDAARLVVFTNALLDAGFEGEALTLAVAGLFELFMSGETDDYKVEVHPVNQSGSSSKEVSDLDVYKYGRLYVANELKDKSFTDHDVRHAADKVAAAGKSHLNFIVGRHGGADERQVGQCVAEYLANGFVINIVPVDYFVLTLFGLIEHVDIDRYVKFILSAASESKFKEETIAFVRGLVAEQFRV